MPFSFLKTALAQVRGPRGRTAGTTSTTTTLKSTSNLTCPPEEVDEADESLKLLEPGPRLVFSAKDKAWQVLSGENEEVELTFKSSELQELSSIRPSYLLHSCVCLWSTLLSIGAELCQVNPAMTVEKFVSHIQALIAAEANDDIPRAERRELEVQIVADLLPSPETLMSLLAECRDIDRARLRNEYLERMDKEEARRKHESSALSIVYYYIRQVGEGYLHRLRSESTDGSETVVHDVTWTEFANAIDRSGYFNLPSLYPGDEDKACFEIHIRKYLNLVRLAAKVESTIKPSMIAHARPGLFDDGLDSMVEMMRSAACTLVRGNIPDNTFPGTREFIVVHGPGGTGVKVGPTTSVRAKGKVMEENLYALGDLMRKHLRIMKTDNLVYLYESCDRLGDMFRNFRAISRACEDIGIADIKNRAVEDKAVNKVIENSEWASFKIKELYREPLPRGW